MSLRPEIRSGLLLAGPVILLIAGVTILFSLRFRAGDIYPPYSSLRSDPLGTRILHDSLHGLPGVAVSRNREPHLDLLDAPETTLLFLGFHPRMGKPIPEVIPDLAWRGTRVIVAFHPQRTQGGARSGFRWEVSEPEDGAEPGAPSLFVPIDPLAEEILDTGLRLSHAPAGSLPPTADEVALAQPAGGLAGTGPIPWRSHLAFEIDLVPEDGEPTWQVLYTLGGRPVAVERAWGEGSLVLLTDSYLFSNEAMVVDRRPQVLSHLLGGNPALVFDETFHGVTRKPGVMGMIRRFRMQGFLSGLLLLALLYIWNQATALVPPPAGEELAALNGGMPSSKGFDALLRQHLPPAKLLDACAGEWLASSDHAARVPQRRREIEALLPDPEEILPPARILDTFRRMQAAAQRRQGLGQPAAEPPTPGQTPPPRPDPNQDEDHAGT